MPFFPFEMSHKKRRESTKTPGEEITGFLFFETTRKNSAFYDIYVYILRVFSTAKARIYSSLPTWTSSSFVSSSSSSNVRKKDIHIERMNRVKRFDEWIASRPILIASVTFTIGITLTAIAFLVTGIRVSTEGTLSIRARSAFVSLSRLPYFYLFMLTFFTLFLLFLQDGTCEGL